MNLAYETKSVLKRDGYALSDVMWVGSADGYYACGIGYFLGLADREYDNGFGSQEVAQDLVMVMRDGSWYMRQEYDGSEGWDHMRPPVLGGKKGHVIALDKIWLDDGAWYTVHQAMSDDRFGDRWIHFDEEEDQ